MEDLDFTGKKVAIIGDVMLDRYLVGQSTRLSPEAPVPVLENYSTEDRLGGAANVACNIVGFGAQAFLFGLIGDDESGTKIKSIIGEVGIVDCLYIDSSRKTTLKTRVMKDDEHLLRVDQEDTHDIDKQFESEFVSSLQELHNKVVLDSIILQDYNKGVLSASLILKIIVFAKKHSIYVSVDPKFKNIQSYRDCTLFKPNLKEVEGILSRKILNFDDLKLANVELRSELNFEYLVITLGSKGIYISSKNEEVLVEAQPLKTVDVCGAGDGVISYLALKLGNITDIKELGEVSNLVGRIICSYPGVTSISHNLLKRHLADFVRG